MPDELARNHYLGNSRYEREQLMTGAYKPHTGTLPSTEPPIGSVVSFLIKHPMRETFYNYAAVRAGDGRWYITGGETKQGVDWATFTNAINPRMVGPMKLLREDRDLFL